MESLVIDPKFWRDRSVLITGCTGVKGGWLALWLSQLGAEVHGYSLAPPTTPNFFSAVNLGDKFSSLRLGDICDRDALIRQIDLVRPSVIIHMAAQALVKKSYAEPAETLATNVQGTVALMEAVRKTMSVDAVVNVTSDKCYEIRSEAEPHVETDRMGGIDPYSCSKACAELITSCYQKSFFLGSSVHVASARAGNILAGGDWSADRLVPDFVRALSSAEPLQIRCPQAIRPWQHVLEPLSGYLLLAERLVADGDSYSEAWNFGPEKSSEKSVAWVVDYLCSRLSSIRWIVAEENQQPETSSLTIDITKAKRVLDWQPRWSVQTALDRTIDWYTAYQAGHRMDEFSLRQIDEYVS